MHLKVRKPIKLTRGNVTVTVRLHQAIRLTDDVGRKVLAKAADLVKRVTPKR